MLPDGDLTEVGIFCFSALAVTHVIDRSGRRGSISAAAKDSASTLLGHCISMLTSLFLMILSRLVSFLFYIDRSGFCTKTPAVDAHVGQSLFHDAILPLAHTEGKTVLLVTHAQHFLAKCDYIYTLENGRIAEHGAYVQLIKNQGEFARLDKEFGGHKALEDDDPEGNEAIQKGGHADLQEVKIKSELKSSGAAGTGKLEGRLIRKEARSVGSVSWTGEHAKGSTHKKLTKVQVYKSYLSAGTWFITMPLAICSVLLMQGSQIMNSYTLVWWQAK